MSSHDDNDSEKLLAMRSEISDDDKKKFSAPLSRSFFFISSRPNEKFNHRLESLACVGGARLTLHVIILDGRTRIGRLFLLHLRSITLLRYHAFTFTY